MRRACVVLGLLGCVAQLVTAASTRADWQPTAPPPPVPPETENAQRARTPPAEPAPAGATRDATARSHSGAVPSKAEPARNAQPPSASDTPASQHGALPQKPNVTGTAAQAAGDHGSTGSADAPPPATGVVHGSTAAGKSPRGDVEPLRLFPPAPPPIVPRDPPERPTTALTNFAPAPAPPPVAVEPAPAPGAGQLAPAAGVVSTDPPPLAVSAGGPKSGVAANDPSAAAQQTAPGEARTAAAEQPAAVSGESRRPADATNARWSAAGLAGIGATFDNTIAGVNPMGFGFGVRGDYRLLPEWSVGARVLYFVGGSVELPSDDVAMQSWLLAAEGAYVLEFAPLTIQPGLALGLFVRESNYRGFDSFTSEPSNTSITLPDSTRLFLYVAPGVNVSVPLSVAAEALAPLTVGADVRLDVAFGRRVTSNIQLLLQVGLRF